ncbi:MAG: hypothetical protein JWR39_1913 [Devosia sp.]|jgi:hypothetical protein|nr:hypothetical protein [Devosia sp.]
MTLDDLKRLFTRQTLFKLDAILAPKLVPILYALGLAGILLWAVSHLFWTFGFGFGNGLWGLLEIAVFGLLLFVGLRIGCEALLVWFKAHEGNTETVTRSRYAGSLLDEVRDAIRDLAEAGEDKDFAEADEYILDAVDTVTPLEAEREEATIRSPATKAGEVFKKRRTSKRTPRINNDN